MFGKTQISCKQNDKQSTIFTDNGVNVSNDLTQIWKLEIISNTEYHANSEKKGDVSFQFLGAY